MDGELADGLGLDAVGRFVITRSGTALCNGDLQRVAASHARTVVVMSPDDGDEVIRGFASSSAGNPLNAAAVSGCPHHRRLSRRSEWIPR